VLLLLINVETGFSWDYTPYKKLCSAIGTETSLASSALAKGRAPREAREQDDGLPTRAAAPRVESK
jgi:hypothetical protein